MPEPDYDLRNCPREFAKTASNQECRERKKKWRLGQYNRNPFCCYCGVKMWPPGVHPGSKRACTIDHIRPKCEGGTNAIKNLQLACNECNAKKGPFKSIEEREALVGYKPKRIRGVCYKCNSTNVRVGICFDCGSTSRPYTGRERDQPREKLQ